MWVEARDRSTRLRRVVMVKTTTPGMPRLVGEGHPLCVAGLTTHIPFVSKPLQVALSQTLWKLPIFFNYTRIESP